MSNIQGGAQISNYTGTKANQPPNWHFLERDPTIYDTQNVSLGDLWMNKLTSSAWILVSLAGDSESRGQLAEWQPWGEIKTLESNSGGEVHPDDAGNIFLLGDGTTIIGVGTPDDNTITYSTGASVATSYITNPATGTAVPAAGVLTFAGTGGTTITTAGSTVTVNSTDTGATSFPTNAGTATPASGVVQVLGSHGLNTTGSGNVITVLINNIITLGDLTPVVGNALTVTSGDIEITAGSLDVISGNVAVTTGNILISNTNAAGTSGVIKLGGDRFISNRGTQNTFVGQLSGNTSLTTGLATGNTAVGYFSGTAITTATGCTMVGVNCGPSITSASSCTAVGSTSLFSTTNSTGQTAVGSNSLMSSNGNSNTAIGALSGQNLTTGQYNVFIGADGSGVNLTGAESSNIYISNQGILGESNATRIGEATGTGNYQQNKCFISGIRGITTAVADAVAVLIDSAGQLGTVSSSIRYKENVKDMGSYSDPINLLRPVLFTYKNSSSKKESVGLIAEEVDTVMPSLVVYNTDVLPETVKYQDLIPLMLNEIQKLNKRVKELESKQ